MALSSERRFWFLLVPALLLLAVVLVAGYWFFTSLEWFAGVRPDDPQVRSGVATVQNCERSLRESGLMYRCEADVRWTAVQDGRWSGAPQNERAEIITRDALTGTVPVEEHGHYFKRSRIRQGVVPASRLRLARGGLEHNARFVLPGIGFIAGVLGIGFYLVHRYRHSETVPEDQPRPVTRKHGGK